MNILVTEDNEDKRNAIVSFISSCGVPAGRIRTACNVVEFGKQFDSSISICVIDLRLPSYEGGDVIHNGIAILQAIEARKDPNIRLLAISAYPEEFEPARGEFERRGCVIVDYHMEEVWKGALRQMITNASARTTFDFLIFAALREERTPYTLLPELKGKIVNRDNMLRYDIELGEQSGSIIDLPRMGLVDAASTIGVCLERFNPRIVCMTGICGGFDGRAELGELLVADIAYEYQSGKWSEDGFASEPYQVPLQESVRSIVRELVEDSNLLSRLESGWRDHRPSKPSRPRLALMTSGSAVIASESVLGQVSTLHRKVGGLDMETYGLYRAAHLHRGKSDFVSAKVVVDLANAAKDDRLHPYGADISAKFMIAFLRAYFSSATVAE